MTTTALRSPAVDVIRVLAMVFIVYRHTFVVPLEDQSILLSWTVPFFFFLTGWLWKTGARTVREEAGRRWRSLGVPYVSWFAIIWLVYAAVTIASGDIDVVQLAKPFAGSVHAVRPFTTFWFISALVFVAVFYRLIDRLPTTVQLGIGAAVLVVGWLAGELLSKVPLSAGTAVVCVAFVIAGRLLRRYASTISRRSAAIAAALIAGTVAVSPSVPPIDVKYGAYGAPLLSSLVSVAMCWAVIILASFLFEALPTMADRLGRPAAALTSVAMLVILTHPFALYLMDATRSDVHWWHYLVALVVPWSLGLLIARTPARRFMIGS